jgi:hypothetical protein
MERFERFARGTLPPSAFVGLIPGPPPVVASPPTTHERGAKDVAPPSQGPRGTCDLASMCPTCGTLMQPEHAHYRCATCGYRDSCCF